MQLNRSSTMLHTPGTDVEDELLKTLPMLRKYALSLCRQSGHAEDLMQETMVRALANINSFEPGSSMRAWLFTILRNLFYSEYRKLRQEVGDDDGRHASQLETRPVQEGHMHFLDVRDALDQLPPEFREALILVGASELSYVDAAARCKCPVGTMKSRVSRARDRMVELLDVPAEHYLSSSFI
jgi:RNA polymerase sigma-70 factor (ECF subfamily)